jgi:integrase/recombinase XerD
MRTGRPKGDYPLNNNFSELREHYKTWLVTLGFSAHIVKGNPQILYHFLNFLENRGICHITNLTAKHVNDYFEHLQTRQNMRIKGKALSKAHLNKNFDCIDKFLEFLHHRGMDNAPQPTRHRATETKNEIMKKVKAFKHEEIQTLYDTTKKLFPQLSFKDREPRQALATLILDLCYGCGLRRSEAYNLLVEDVNLDKQTLFVRQAKGYKDRYVPINKTVNKRIELFVYQHRRAFNVEHKRLFPLSFHCLPYYFKILLKNSGLHYETGTGLHILRHSIATHLLQNGMNIEQIARFLGHETLDSTQVYTHLTKENEK